MEIALYSALIDQSWLFFWLLWSFCMCWFVLWGLEVPTFPFSWVKLASKMNGPILLHAPITRIKRGLEGPLNDNFLEIFWHFPNPYIKWDQKSLEEQRKVNFFAIWVTLSVYPSQTVLFYLDIMAKLTLEYHFLLKQFSNCPARCKIPFTCSWDKM